MKTGEIAFSPIINNSNKMSFFKTKKVQYLSFIFATPMDVLDLTIQLTDYNNTLIFFSAQRRNENVKIIKLNRKLLLNPNR